MKLGIMQPYFFPYLGYFSLIKHTDRWIVFDTVQYIEHGWMNRNRIIHPDKPEDMYITVPLVKHARDTKIKDIQVNRREDYREKILAQLWSAYKKRARYFPRVYALAEDVLSYDTERLSDLNVYGMKKVTEYLEIPFHYDVFSEMALMIDEVHDAGEWALNISKALHADTYINPPGGVALFAPEKFRRVGIRLEFLKAHLQPYAQKKAQFISGLSIIDVMMFNSPDRINEMLDDYEIFSRDTAENDSGDDKV